LGIGPRPRNFVGTDGRKRQGVCPLCYENMLGEGGNKPKKRCREKKTMRDNEGSPPLKGLPNLSNGIRRQCPRGEEKVG